MNNINWSQLRPNVPQLFTWKRDGSNCIALAVSKYNGLPWFVNSTFVAPAVNILSDDVNFISIFDAPKPIATSDSKKLFKSITACIHFLRSKKLALASIDMDTLCHSNDNQYACQLSPKCKVVNDPSGQLLVGNLSKIFKLAPFRKNRRTAHAKHVTRISSLSKHPASWNHLEDAALLADTIMYTGKSSLKSLDRLIRTKDNNGRCSWANHAAIRRDFGANKKKYDVASFRDLVRFIRNKLAHFNAIKPDLRKLFGSPKGVINYFNRHVVRKGDLVFAIWVEINGKNRLLKHHWVV